MEIQEERNANWFCRLPDCLTRTICSWDWWVRKWRKTKDDGRSRFAVFCSPVFLAKKRTNNHFIRGEREKNEKRKYRTVDWKIEKNCLNSHPAVANPSHLMPDLLSLLGYFSLIRLSSACFPTYIPYRSCYFLCSSISAFSPVCLGSPFHDRKMAICVQVSVYTRITPHRWHWIHSISVKVKIFFLDLIPWSSGTIANLCLGFFSCSYRTKIAIQKRAQKSRKKLSAWQFVHVFFNALAGRNKTCLGEKVRGETRF